MIFSAKQLRRGWTDWHLVMALLMVAVGVAATFNAWVNLFNTTAARGDMRHLWLLPLVIVWLIWVRRQRMQMCQPGGTWIGPLLLIGGWLVSILGQRVGVEVLWHAGAVVVVMGCVTSVLGYQLFRAFLPAFVALLFIVPLPYGIELRLAVATGDLAATLVQPTPVGYVMAMQEAAPALKFAVLLAYAFAFGMPYRTWVRLLLLVVSPLAAMLMLMLQMISYELMLGWWQPPRAESVTNMAGWLLLPLTLALLMGLIRLLRWAAVPLQYYKLADEA